MKSWTKLFVLALIAAVAVGCGAPADSGGGAAEPAGDTPTEEAPAEGASAAPAEPAGEMAAAEEPAEGSGPAEEMEEAAEEAVEEAAEEATEEAMEETGGGSEDLSVMMSEWKEAFASLDLEKATANYADDYEDAESGSREEYLEWINGIVEQGFLEGLTISDEDAEVEVDGDEATAGPYDIESDAGAWTLDVYLEKRDGTWKIVSTDVY